MDRVEPLRLLVIEDDEDTRANLRDILELDDHRVEAAASAAEAFGPRDWPAFDAIILDRRLPDATAAEVLPRLKQRAPDAAIIVVTGHGDLQGAIAALRLGAADYILKPLNPEMLRASLARVADRRRLERDRARSEARFRHLVEAAECLILIVGPDGTIAYLSPFTERLTGYSAAEARGRDGLELLVPPPSRAAFEAACRRALGGEPVRGLETPVRCRDGDRRWVLWNARRLDDLDGSSILAVGQDITTLKQAQDRAVQSERLAAIGQMVAGLAHESRNALQRSQACLEMLGLEVQDRPRARDLISRLQRAQEHLHTLYEDVRGYAAPIVLERRPGDLAAIWRLAWAHLERPRAGRVAGLQEEAEGLDLTIAADPFRLEQVFRNLFDNALAACPDPVVIAIRAREDRLDDRPALRVTLRDNGPGIEPDRRPRVFEPFFTTKTKGTGLGLPIARRIVEAHGGRIAVGEGPGPGAEFVITLPREAP